MSSATAQHRPMLGIGLMLGFCLIAPMMDALAKLISDDVPPGQIATLRFALQSALLLPFVALTGRLYLPQFAEIKLHCLRHRVLRRAFGDPARIRSSGMGRRLPSDHGVPLCHLHVAHKAHGSGARSCDDANLHGTCSRCDWCPDPMAGQWQRQRLHRSSLATKLHNSVFHRHWDHRNDLAYLPVFCAVLCPGLADCTAAISRNRNGHDARLLDLQ